MMPVRDTPMVPREGEFTLQTVIVKVFAPTNWTDERAERYLRAHGRKSVTAIREAVLDEHMTALVRVAVSDR